MPHRIELKDGQKIYVNSLTRANDYIPILTQARSDLLSALKKTNIPPAFYLNVFSDINLWTSLAGEMDSMILAGKDPTAFAQDFQKNIKTAIERSYKHIKEIQQHFNTDKPIHLAKITATNGDPHKGGQRVLLMDFSDDKFDENIHTIVYKPSVINIDDCLVGTHPHSDDEKKREPSIIELLNPHLAKLQKTQLPTYRFIIGDSTIEGGYGFIEHLPHRPWPMTSPRRECYRVIEEFCKQEKEQKREHPDYEKFPAFLQNELKTFFSELYRDYPYYHQLIDQVKDLKSYIQVQFECELMNRYQYGQKWHHPNDFIIADEKAYSFERGCNLALAYIFRIADLHMENAITSQQHFKLTDLECACQPTCNSIDDTFLLRANGAMGYQDSGSHFWVEPDEKYEFHRELIDTRSPAQSKAFKVTEQGGLGKRLVPCLIDEEAFRDGFDSVWKIVRENPGTFIGALEKQHTTAIRVVPYKTPDWQTFTAEKERTSRKQNDEKAWDPSSGKPPKHIVLDQAATVDALDSGNIPVFYCLLSDTFLLDEHGHPITPTYHDKPPLTYVAERIQTLAAVPEELHQEIHTTIETLNNETSSAPTLLARLKPVSSLHASELNSQNESPHTEEEKPRQQQSTTNAPSETKVSGPHTPEEDWAAEFDAEETRTKAATKNQADNTQIFKK